jgi:hypothetical protein
MQKVKKQESEKAEVVNKVDSFSKFQKARMVRITGSFMKGGFNISQNKVKAILENIDVMEKFVKGDFNSKIDELEEDEILKV